MRWRTASAEEDETIVEMCLALYTEDPGQQVTAEQVMVPLERLVWVGSDDELMFVLRAMDDAGVVEVPVIDGSRFVGIISRKQVLHYIRMRTELGV